MLYWGMSISDTTVVLLGAAVVLAWSLSRRRWRGGTRVARTLRWAAVAAATVATVLLLPAAWRDSGAVALILLGAPVTLVLAAAVAPWYQRTITWVASLAAVGWGLLLFLGAGFPLLVAPLLLLAAAVVQHTHPAAAPAGPPAV